MKKAILGAAFAGVLALGVCLSLIIRRVAEQAWRDEARPADLILVLGAAEYHGRPSPVFKARLDHALQLYRQRLAPRIMTTGGSGGDPLFTEGGVGRAYLIGHNVPSEAILVEGEGESTAYSTAAAGEMMMRMGLESCIVVSDGYHIFRVKRILEHRGLRVYGSPRQPYGATAWQYFRESVGYLLWSAGLR
jgi:uncharacterized SAM-binding protein YcdF (DUF218 family)